MSGPKSELLTRIGDPRSGSVREGCWWVLEDALEERDSGAPGVPFGELLRGSEEVRWVIGDGTASRSFLGESIDMDRPRSVGNFLVGSPLFADAVRSRRRKLSGGRPSSFAGSDWPIESKIPATSSENDMVTGRRRGNRPMGSESS